MCARRALAVSLSLSLLAPPACRSANAYDVGAQDATGATLVVRLDNFADAANLRLSHAMVE